MNSDIKNEMPDFMKMFKSMSEEELEELDKKEEKYQKEKAERERKMEDENRNRLFYSNIPKRYKDVKEPLYQEMIDSTCSIIWGGFGTGKTWESYAVCRRMCLDGKIKSFNLVTEIGLLNELKGGFNDGSFNSRIDKFKKTGLLIVDEIGKSNDTEFNKALLFEILNTRYDWMRKTILICNAEKKEDLFNIMSTSILDRYRESIIHMGGGSKRYNGKQSNTPD